MSEQRFFIDPVRCIGCKSCMQACSECATHKGKPATQFRTQPTRNQLQHHHIRVIRIELAHYADHRLPSSAMARARSRWLPPRMASTNTKSS